MKHATFLAALIVGAFAVSGDCEPFGTLPQRQMSQLRSSSMWSGTGAGARQQQQRKRAATFMSHTGVPGTVGASPRRKPFSGVALDSGWRYGYRGAVPHPYSAAAGAGAQARPLNLRALAVPRGPEHFAIQTGRGVVAGTYFSGGGGYTVYHDGRVITDAERRVNELGRFNTDPVRRLPTFQNSYRR